MESSSQKAKLELRDALSAYIIDYKRVTNFFPTAIQISERESCLIRELITEFMVETENCEKYYYEASNNPLEDTLLVFEGCDLVVDTEENVKAARAAVK